MILLGFELGVVMLGKWGLYGEREEWRRRGRGIGIPSLPPVNLTVICLSMYFPRSRMFSFLGLSVLDPWPPRPPSCPPASK